MKKKEKISLIHKLAYEYAKSGKCKDYQSIEFKIRFDDNLPEARRVLDNIFIRDELNKLCLTATSEIEVKRRNDFNLFIDKIQNSISTLVKEILPEISLINSQDFLLISHPKYSVELKRIFNSNKLCAEKIIEHKDDKMYRFKSGDSVTEKDFQKLSEKEIIELIKSLAQSAESMYRNI